MTNSRSGKSLWEYILLAVSGFATLVQVLGLISQSQTLFAQPAITATFVVVILIGTAIGCIFVLMRRKPGTFTAKVPYYTSRQRVVAGGLLGTNFIVSLFVLGSMIWRPCLRSQQPIPPEKFGILVAHFTEGPDRSPTIRGLELTQRTLNSLRGRLAASSLADKVEVRGICAIKNDVEARQAGQSADASLVLWGNVAEFAQGAFEPSFTFVDPLSWPYDIDPVIFEVELNRVDSIELPSKISARATSIASFVVGLIYLREAKNDQDYYRAIAEFSSAIANTQPELANLVRGSEQELAVKRTMATFHVMRGRAFAALNEDEIALGDYSAAETYDPNYPSLYVARGNYYYELRDFGQAQWQYRQATFLSESASAYYGLGNTLFYLKHYQASKYAYLRAISIIESKGDDASGVRIVLGAVYNSRGETQLAVEQLNNVLQSERASSAQKEQAGNLLESIVNSTPSPTITPITPTVASLNTETSTPTVLPFVTMVLVENTPTQRPIQATLFPTLFPTPASLLYTPTATLFPPPSPTLVPSLATAP